MSNFSTHRDPLRRSLRGNHLSAPVEHEVMQVTEPVDSEEMAHLRAENAELRARLEEMDQLFQACNQGEESWLERQREYEALLEEKSEVIRDLHHKIQELQEGGGRRCDVAEQDELMELKQQLEKERQQLQEDEDALMDQMREMELSMSRERAEMARQRNELQRLQTDLTHELEAASRDATLRDRLLPLQRRQQEIVNRRGNATPGPSAGAAHPVAPSDPTPPPKKQGSGLFRRLFGGSENG